MDKDKLTMLWAQYLSGRMGRAERKKLAAASKDPGLQDHFEELVSSSVNDYASANHAYPGNEEQITKIMERIKSKNTTVVHRAHFRGTAWLKYAAAIIIILGTAGYLLTRFPDENKHNIAANGIQKDFSPGTSKAILTLGDGSVIVLDSANNGTIAQQAGAEIIKLANGEIAYNSNGANGKQAVMNTMRTPNGGKYQLTLPDGTKVWLNAASSITYPVVFTGEARSVRITGEVYFEVVSDKVRPFTVSKGNTYIQVLGTHFNINAYEDEKNMKVTLLEGSVRVSEKQTGKAVILAPGQQAQVTDDYLSTFDNTDIAKVMAWKNGLFNFEDADLQEVMRQIARWYDIKVIYEKDIPDIQLWGKMSRHTSLSGLLNNLKDVGVRYKINEERRELIILP